ncbi:uncharacterized protein LOC134831818 [Culicoides brevitarsis]|uniref:uncharacterized protein LOC134831818 n=1 Tax=Culicoides brevitarsis TaxID=469753 RepID=UPI00307C6F93
MVEFSFVSFPSAKNVEVDTFFIKFDLKIGCFVTSGLGILLSSIMIVFSAFKMTDECATPAECLLTQHPLLPQFAAFFKFMLAAHVLTLAGEICLLLGTVLKMEALLNVWLAIPTGACFTYSTVYSFLVYKDFAAYGYSGVGFAFSLIGLILYLAYLIYAWICVYSFAKKVSQS